MNRIQHELMNILDAVDEKRKQFVGDMNKVDSEIQFLYDKLHSIPRFNFFISNKRVFKLIRRIIIRTQNYVYYAMSNRKEAQKYAYKMCIIRYMKEVLEGLEEHEVNAERTKYESFEHMANKWAPESHGAMKRAHNFFRGINRRAREQDDQIEEMQRQDEATPINANSTGAGKQNTGLDIQS